MRCVSRGGNVNFRGGLERHASLAVESAARVSRGTPGSFNNFPSRVVTKPRAKLGFLSVLAIYLAIYERRREEREGVVACNQFWPEADVTSLLLGGVSVMRKQKKIELYTRGNL